MKNLFMVVEPFKAGGDYYPPGTILSQEELEAVRLFKVRLNEGKIKPVNKDTFKAYHERVKIRYGVDLKEKIAERVSKGSEQAEPTKPEANVSTPTPGTQGEKKPAPVHPVTSKNVQTPSQKK